MTRRGWLGVASAMAVALGAALVGPAATGAQAPDPAATEQERDDVRARQGQVALEVDALAAQDADVRAALTEIERNVASQQAGLRQAERAQAQAEADLASATRAVADAQRRIDDLDRQADRLVVDSFVNPPSQTALESLVAGSVTEAAVMQAVLAMEGDRDAQVLDRLAQAHDQLAAEQGNRREAAADADAARQAAARGLADVEAALAQQQAFAADVERRLNAKLAEAESLKTLDAALSERLTREQEALAAQLAAAQAAQEAAAPDATAGEITSEIGNVEPPQIAPAPGGLVTVPCPTGGSITVAGSIGPNAQALLDAAAAGGVLLCGGGYRDPQEQVELRMANCGTSDYAMYEMPASQCDPPTAIPGTSMHEQGLAIDFTCNGGGTVDSSDECFAWLQANAASYALYNLPSEPWHWSTNGS